MNDEKITDLLFEINGKLAKIDTKIDSLSETIMKHETRLTTLENKLNAHLIDFGTIKSTDKDDFKSELLKLLAKSLVVALASIGTLVGASGLITKIIGQ